MHVLRSVVFVLVYQSAVSADCSGATFKCPSGENFSVDRCWNWLFFSCRPCGSIINSMKTKCPQYGCSKGDVMSVSKWHGRNDYCSAGFVSQPLNSLVSSSCYIHDLCYSTPGPSRLQCDKDFFHNMKKEIANTAPPSGIISSTVYLTIAASAYAAVRAQGKKHEIDCRKVSRLVSCGGHYAKDCSKCPNGNGASWCHGKCTWRNGRCVIASLYKTLGKTSWGHWSRTFQCRRGQYIVGFRIKVESDQRGGDDTALNDIEVKCSDGQIGRMDRRGDWGNWKAWQTCPPGHQVVRFNFRSEGVQGEGDDTSGNNVYMKCSDGSSLHGGGQSWGSWDCDWTDDCSCTYGHKLCSIQTMVESGCGKCDDTSLNKIKFGCCK